MYTTYEVMRLLILPIYFNERSIVMRTLLKGVTNSRSHNLDLIDVGGRFSPYTIGIPANVTVTDLERTTSLQEDLNLGITSQMETKLIRKRSNIKEVVLDDMTQSNLPDSCADIVTAVEVLEHVEADNDFVRNVYRILRPGGVFIATTPNGHCIRNNNPDHIRHYRKDELEKLLEFHFATVNVGFAVKNNRIYRNSQRSIRENLLSTPVIIGSRIIAFNRTRDEPYGDDHQKITANLIVYAQK